MFSAETVYKGDTCNRTFIARSEKQIDIIQACNLGSSTITGPVMCNIIMNSYLPTVYRNPFSHHKQFPSQSQKVRSIIAHFAVNPPSHSFDG